MGVVGLSLLLLVNARRKGGRVVPTGLLMAGGPGFSGAVALARGVLDARVRASVRGLNQTVVVLACCRKGLLGVLDLRPPSRRTRRVKVQAAVMAVVSRLLDPVDLASSSVEG